MAAKCLFKIAEKSSDAKGKLYVLQCSNCHFRITRRQPYFGRECKGVETTPNLLQQAANYIVSTAKHIAGGCKLREQEEINAIFEICRNCKFGNVGKQDRETAKSITCGKCGCGGNTTQSHLTNKLARKDEKCPLNPPKWGSGTDNP